MARNVAKQLGISYSSGQGDVVEDIDWIGGANEVLQFLYRRNFFDFPLQMRGLRLQFPSDVSILYRDEGDYAAGLYEEGVELLPAEKLRKSTKGLSQLKPHGPDENWALWFHDFEEEAQKRGIPVVQ